MDTNKMRNLHLHVQPEVLYRAGVFLLLHRDIIKIKEENFMALVGYMKGARDHKKGTLVG